MDGVAAKVMSPDAYGGNAAKAGIISTPPPALIAMVCPAACGSMYAPPAPPIILSEPAASTVAVPGIPGARTPCSTPVRTMSVGFDNGDKDLGLER